MFTPTITSLNKLADENPKLPSHALVSTEFVAWCSARFTEPILDMLQGKCKMKYFNQIYQAE